MNRTDALLKIRPTIVFQKISDSSESENFQNDTLRPILKLQHDFLCLIFLKTPVVFKQNFDNKHEDQKKVIINVNLKSNHKLKSQIIDAITSLMTIEELNHYFTQKSEYQKRIISMAKQRLIDGLIV